MTVIQNGMNRYASAWAAFWHSLKLQGRVIQALFLRETKTRFGDRRLGFIWAFLEAALHVMIFVSIRTFVGMEAPSGSQGTGNLLDIHSNSTYAPFTPRNHSTPEVTYAPHCPFYPRFQEHCLSRYFPNCLTRAADS